MPGLIRSSEFKILLVRHGETDWNRIRRFQGWSDIPLNTTGHEQAQALAFALKDELITAIHSSPLQRAVETALHIGKFHPEIPLHQEPGLMEMNLGDFEGMKAEQWAAQHQEFKEAWEHSPAELKMPNGESLKDVQRRGVDVLQRVLEATPSGSTLLICSHNFLIVSLLCFVLKTPLDRFRELRQGTAALNVFYKKGTAFQVERINDCSHVPKKQ